MLLKMRDYALVPVLFAVCLSRAARRALLIGFAAGTILSVVISVGLAAGGVHALNMLAGLSLKVGEPVFQAVPGDWMVFRTHTYHNLFALMLVVGLLSLHLNKAFSGKWRWISAAIIGVSLLDIMFLVQGRTIQLLSMLILALVLVLWDRRKGIILAVCSGIVLLPALYFASENIRKNLNTIGSNVNEYEQGQKETSVGYLLDFYKNSLALLMEKPLLGHGTGSFTSEYRRLTGYGEGNLATNNPHNDYLWFGVEQGVFGIAALLGIIVTTVVQARNRARPEQWTAMALAAAMALGSLGNSLFSDNIPRTGFILLACALLAGDSFGTGNKTKSTLPVV
jgi:O-antigen ligase